MFMLMSQVPISNTIDVLLYNEMFEFIGSIHNECRVHITGIDLCTISHICTHIPGNSLVVTNASSLLFRG
jgi:hypothetical protein